MSLAAKFRRFIDQFPGVALAYRRLRDDLDRKDIPKETPWGFKLAGHDSMAAGQFEPEETKVVRELLLSCNILVNVGANIGYYCCHALSLGKDVIAFEPVRRNLHYLLTNLRINGWSQQCEVFPLALGDQNGIVKIWGGQTGASIVKGWASIPEGYYEYTPVLTLDRALHGRLNGLRPFILVDIEGAEFQMLQGAKEILNHEPRPIWMIEIAFAENQPNSGVINNRFEATFNMLFDAGYRAFLPGDDLEELTQESIASAVENNKPFSRYSFLFM